MGRSKQVSLLLGLILLGLIITISISSAYAFLAPTFLFKFGPIVPGGGQFNGPIGVGVDSSDNIYVTDGFGTRTIQVFDKTGAFLFKFGPSFPDGSFSLPFDVTVDSQGRILVIDCAVARIMVFDSSGIFLFFIGTPGSGVGQFRCPSGITVDGSDNIYVADSSNRRIQVFDKTGASQFIIGPIHAGGSFGFPETVTVDSNGRIIVADLGSRQVQIFDSSGNFLNKFGGSPPFSSGPSGVAVDSSDNIYVTDISRSDIQIFDSSGNFLNKFGGSGSGDGQFFRPWDLAIDSSGHIVVPDQGNRRVQVFGTSDTTPPAITAALIPICGEDDEGLFTVSFTATDVDPNPAVSALLNGITVFDGDTVKLENNLVVPIVITEIENFSQNEVSLMEVYKIPKKIVSFTFQKSN